MKTSARTIVVALLAAVIGATAFHIYYRRLDPIARCGWDHPTDASAKAGCVAAGSPGYGRGARRQLDDLIGTVTH